MYEANFEFNTKNIQADLILNVTPNVDDIVADIEELNTNKQDVLTAGANIQINDNVISATDTTYTAGTGISIVNGVISNTGSEITVDDELSTTSENPVQNKVITTELNKKIESITSSDITTALGFTPYDAANPDGYITSANIGNGALTIQRNGSAVGTFTANQTSASTINISVPTTASEVGALPDSTTIGSANLTIKRNNTALGTFSANATEAIAIDITVPTTATDVGALPSSTTITDLVSTTQMNAINSGITASGVTAIATNTSGIAAINSLIPSATTANNQLADKAFVNSSVQTATANFRGNWASWSAVPTSANDYPEDYAGSKTPTVNDYLVVQDASGYTGQTLEGTWRFKYSGDWATDGKSGWLPEYQVNETPMTSAQLAALNSGITAAGVTQIATNTSAIAGKQDTLTAGSNITISGNTISATDTTYSAGANVQITNGTISATDTIYTLPVATTSSLGGIIVGNNLSISGGTLSATDTIYTLPIAASNTLGGVKVGSNLSIDANGVLSADAQSITVDTTLSTSSTNPVQNKVVTSALATKTTVTFVDWSS